MFLGRHVKGRRFITGPWTVHARKKPERRVCAATSPNLRRDGPSMLEKNWQLRHCASGREAEGGHGQRMRTTLALLIAMGTWPLQAGGTFVHIQVMSPEGLKVCGIALSRLRAARAWWTHLMHRNAVR